MFLSNIWRAGVCRPGGQQMVSKGRNVVMGTGITAPLFAASSIVADQAGDGSLLLLRSTEPLAVDWLAWSHTFGGNHNVNMELRP